MSIDKQDGWFRAEVEDDVDIRSYTEQKMIKYLEGIGVT